MSKIDNLIQELCPDGVEYKILESVVKMHSGSFVKKDLQDDSYPYPVMNGGTGATGFYKEFNSNANCIAVSSRGANCGAINYMIQKFWAGNSCYVLDPISEEINGRYLYHVLACLLPAEVEKKKQVAGIPALNTKPLMQLLIPVPPIEVQEEIVRVLDSFVELEAELEAELERRKAQYVYYRGQLLTLKMKTLIMDSYPDNIEYKRLDDIFDIRGGYTPSKNKDEYWENGTIPWFRMEDIREQGRVLTKASLKVAQAALKKSGLLSKGSVIVATSATIGEHALLGVDAICNQRFTCLTKKESFATKLDDKFIFYYCFILDDYCKKNLTQGSFSSVNMSAFKSFLFPILPVEVQQRIVDILDKFDALVNDISQGLPAEIEARRKQYEYYRDKLLTFKKKED